MMSTVVAVSPEELTDLRWQRLFGDAKPVELEIGVGKGGFLLRRAKALPDVNFFGIEWCNEIYKYAVDRMQRWGLQNVRIVRTDASFFIRNQCPRDSLTALHVYHPDPWPKKRHHKRRLFQAPFTNAAVGCLVPGGRLAVQTDHAEYFEQIAGLLRGCTLLEETAFDDPQFGVDAQRVATNFEIKYAREGREFFQIAMRRRVE